MVFLSTYNIDLARIFVASLSPLTYSTYQRYTRAAGITQCQARNSHVLLASKACTQRSRTTGGLMLDFVGRLASQVLGFDSKFYRCPIIASPRSAMSRCGVIGIKRSGCQTGRSPRLDPKLLFWRTLNNS